ncbi:MAG: hypothetical protein HZA93_02080 [Verrucomicrobia bacterium]|nr:hypothetical protein [Verrucomicrobiota bacterium]
MKTKISLVLAFTCILGHAADPATKAPDTGLTGEITPKLIAFDYFDGVGANRTSFLERYDVRRGWSGDTRSGLLMDLDLNLVYQSVKKQSFVVNRWGEGQYRHGGRAVWNNERAEFTADYNFIRTTSSGLDYLFGPDQVPGGTDPSYFFPASTNSASGYAAQFNDDSHRTVFHSNRLTYGLGFKILPGVLGANTTVAVNYAGYLRYGHRRMTYALGGSDVVKAPIAPTSSFVLERWRGINQPIDENMNRLTWNVSAAPQQAFVVAYTGSWEGFDNRARTFTHADIPLVAPYSYNATADRTRPLGFIPDSTLLSHAVRVSKQIGRTNVAAGYANSKLEQDTFTAPQIRLGYTTGQAATESAYFNFDTTVNSAVALQGFVRTGHRENNSSYPVTGLIDGGVGKSQTLGVRLNRLESTTYGLAAAVRPKGLLSTITLGWKSEQKNRDLTYHATEIIPLVSLYRSDTDTHEVYAKLSALNFRGVTLRLNSSYAWAEKTGLVTEPSRAVGLKAAASYAAPNGLLLNAYYHVKDQENDHNSLTDKAVATPATYTQDISSTVQSGGLSLNMQPAKDANAYVSLDWMRMDASVLFFESNRRRFETTTTFALRDLVGSLVDHYLFAVGADYKAGKDLKFNVAYNLTSADGNLASGSVAAALGPIDDTLDSVLHSVVIGTAWDLSKTQQLRVGYRLDKYEDSAYPQLSGGVHSIAVSMSIKL